MFISETLQAMPIKFAVKIVRLKVYMTIPSPMSQTWLLFNLQYLPQYLSYYIEIWHDGRLMHGFELDIDSENIHKWVGRGKKSALNYLYN